MSRRALRYSLEVRPAPGPDRPGQAGIVGFQQALGRQPVQVEFGLVVRDSDGVGRLVTAHRRRLSAHELVEPVAHWIGECTNAGGVALQRVHAIHVSGPFLTDKMLDATVYRI